MFVDAAKKKTAKVPLNRDKTVRDAGGAGAGQTKAKGAPPPYDYRGSDEFESSGRCAGVSAVACVARHRACCGSDDRASHATPAR